MVELTIIFLGLLLLAFGVLKIGDIFSPWFITTGIWFFIVVFFQISSGLLYPYKTAFTFAYYFGFLSCVLRES